MYFNVRVKIMKQLFLIPHNHNYKLSKGENRLVKFVHTDLNYIFFGVAGDCFAMEA